MTLQKLPLELQKEIRNYFLTKRTYNTLTLEEEIQIFADELKNYFSKEELEKIAKEVGFVKRKGTLEAWHFLFFEFRTLKNSQKKLDKNNLKAPQTQRCMV